MYYLSLPIYLLIYFGGEGGDKFEQGQVIIALFRVFRLLLLGTIVKNFKYSEVPPPPPPHKNTCLLRAVFPVSTQKNKNFLLHLPRFSGQHKQRTPKWCELLMLTQDTFCLDWFYLQVYH